MGTKIYLGSIFPISIGFEFGIYRLFIVLNLTCIYMQHLRCCDHSNKCLFLVFQKAEVLLNFLGSVCGQEWFTVAT